MHHNIHKRFGPYLPEHASPGSGTMAATPDTLSPRKLKSAVDAANLTEMWDMILTLDYGVAKVDDLPHGRQDEFLNVMSLLLQAFDR